jgi:hypothetical protein
MKPTQGANLAGAGYRLDGAESMERGAQVAGLITDILNSDAAKRAAPPQKRRFPTMIVLLVLFTSFGVWNFIRITADPNVPVVQTERAARAQLFLVSSALDTWRNEQGRLPRSLEEAGLDMRGVSYVVTDGRYELNAVHGLVRLRYREGQDKAPLAAALGIGGES